MNQPPDLNLEWLEADGQGGFASGTVGGERTRRYHGLLTPAVPAPETRWVMAAGFDAWLEGPGEPVRVFPQRYWPDVFGPDRRCVVARFDPLPWPAWVLQSPEGTTLRQDLLIHRGTRSVVLRWSLMDAAQVPVCLKLRLLLAGRSYHATHHENPAFDFDLQPGPALHWQPYPGVPSVRAAVNGSYAHEPVWYRQFQYRAEQERGLDFLEDLASPGVLSWEIKPDQPAYLLLNTDPFPSASNGLAVLSEQLITEERDRRELLGSPLAKAADVYLVQGRRGRTVIAGYPWFADWGRDTFISIRGLCLANRRQDDARGILLAWSDQVSQGMLPNRFPEAGQPPEYNTVDAALWYVVAAGEWMAGKAESPAGLSSSDASKLGAAIGLILEGYERGTRFGIHAEADGLIAAGVPGRQLTWMDARVGDWVVTPRVGKPVEIQALWINALTVGSARDGRWRPLLAQAKQSFQERFWNSERSCLFDVVDVNHEAGVNDPAIRPNQLFAIGGLPCPALEDPARAADVLRCVENHLWTPAGLRSLSPAEPGYRPYYRGGVMERDGAYHQGTVWPFLVGAFVDAFLHVHGDGFAAREEARTRFLQPLLDRGLNACGIGHLSEIADGDPPHAARGCPFQAWSLGELLRVQHRLNGSGAGGNVPAGTVAAE
ncbi:MAG TPA: amylo-alpha-1,6-glucosidase [Chthoniobacterales bacterium]